MKIKIVIGIFLGIIVISLSTKAEAYLFGMKSWDNSIENIQHIEKEYKLDLPIVSFIFDPRGEHIEQMINRLHEAL